MAELYYPIWMRSSQSLMAAYEQAWVETGDTTLALEEVRALPEYGELFAGNRRADGSVRYDENTYLSVKESYEDVLLSVNVNPDLFSNQFGNLIEGNVAPAEFATRVESLYERVSSQIPEITNYYDQNFGTEMTPSGIMASLIDPEIGQQIINRQIAMAEVGGNAASRGFTVVTDFAEKLVQAGMDTNSEAAQFFGLAEGMMPTLQALAIRHDDPDDDFSLEDFAASQIFSDPEQRRRLRNLTRADAAQYGRASGGAVLQPGELGGATGLIDR